MVKKHNIQKSRQHRTVVTALIGVTASTTKRYASTNTTKKCEYRCNTGFSWTGSACR